MTKEVVELFYWRLCACIKICCLGK